MDRNTFEKLAWLKNKNLLWGSFAVLILAGAGGAFFTGNSGSFFKNLFSASDLIQTYSQAFQSVQQKVDEMRMAEENSRRLALENAHLRLKLESLRFGYETRKAQTETKKLQLTLSQKTGSRVGRTLASLSYVPPTHLLPQQLYTLGVSYFKSRDDEKAAVIFSFLTGLEDVQTYKAPSYWLINGIAWYRLDNFGRANYYFDKVLSSSEAPENLRYQAHARLWKALSAARQKNTVKAQYWLRDLIDHHPHSTEAQWVNSKKVERATASVPHKTEE